MRKILFVLLISILLISCDNGDVTVSSFDLEDSDLSICNQGETIVLYVINNADVHESMSLELQSSQLDPENLSLETGNTLSGETIEIQLSGTNRLVYRMYDGQIESGNEKYFCSAVPPRSPSVVDEYIATDGTVRITTRYNDLAADDDTDGDGINNIDEGMDPEEAANPDSETHQDTDGDGIPDYLDQDDDGDNVGTRTEINITAENEAEDFPDASGNPTPDTNGNGIPDYLDDDDDGDGVLTKYEVNENDEDTWTRPETYIISETGTPNYRNPEIAEEAAWLENEAVREFEQTRDYRSDVQITDFNLRRQTGNEEEIRFDEYNFGRLIVSNINQDEIEEEENEEEIQEP